MPTLPDFCWGPWVDHLLFELEGHICRVIGLGSGVPHWLAQGATLMGHKLKCSWGQANMVSEAGEGQTLGSSEDCGKLGYQWTI